MSFICGVYSALAGRGEEELFPRLFFAWFEEPRLQTMCVYVCLVLHLTRSPRGSSAVDYFANLRQICTVKTIKVALLSGRGQISSSLKWAWSNMTIKVALLSGCGQISSSLVWAWSNMTIKVALLSGRGQI